jgi:hypothetical protein
LRDLKASIARMDAVLRLLYQASPRGIAIQRDQVDWMKKALNPVPYSKPTAAHIQSVNARTVEIAGWLEATKAALGRHYALDEIRTTCVAVPPPQAHTPSAKCSVDGFGHVGTRSDLRYQSYKFPEDQPGPEFMTVVFASHPVDEQYEILGWDADQHKQPVLAYTQNLGTLLILPGFPQGAAGRFFYDSGYVLETPGNTWHEVDVEAWKGMLVDRLPEGVMINSMASVDYNNGIGRVRLMKQGDKMCCPTVGEALVYFNMKDRRLELAKWKLQPNAN